MTEKFYLRVTVEKLFLTKRGKVKRKDIGQYLTIDCEKDIISKNYKDITEILSKNIGEGCGGFDLEED